jgi:hypothetical protein
MRKQQTGKPRAKQTAPPPAPADVVSTAEPRVDVGSRITGAVVRMFLRRYTTVFAEPSGQTVRVMKGDCLYVNADGSTYVAPALGAGPRSKADSLLREFIRDLVHDL